MLYTGQELFFNTPCHVNDLKKQTHDFINTVFVFRKFGARSLPPYPQKIIVTNLRLKIPWLLCYFYKEGTDNFFSSVHFASDFCSIVVKSVSGVYGH